MNTFRAISERLLGTLFPKRCVGCEKDGSFLCTECHSSLPPAQPVKQPFVAALFDYHHPVVKRAIWKFKYGNLRELAKFFSTNLYDEIIIDVSESLYLSNKQTFLLVPIPLHAQRFRERGYNQSELLVRDLLRMDTNDLFDYSPSSLIRIRKTKPQAKSDKREARLKNLAGAFSASSKDVHGRDVLLVDDVVTTGATLSEARKELLKAGARTVHAYVLAH